MSIFSLSLLWMAVATAAAFLLFWRDKRAAQWSRRRTPERVLLAWMVAGGALGALLAMTTLRHKTRKSSFWLVGVLSLLDWCYWCYQQYPV